jgi:N-acetylmuramoyl-L-alanine amidase CwlA
MKNSKLLNKRFRWILLLSILLPFLGAVSFKQILDRTEKKRRKPIEYLVVHYTANISPTATAEMNAKYLRTKRQAGTHYCIDDKEIIQCTEEHNVAYAVGDRHWFGFFPKPWLKNKVYNNNSLSYEMCLGGGRNDSLIIETTAQQLGWQLVNKGFYNSKGEVDLGRVVRHHDVSGKYCPKFVYINPKTGQFDPNYWNQEAEDKAFWKFKQRVRYYAEIHMKRLNKLK